jgi:hypothetical protein
LRIGARGVNSCDAQSIAAIELAFHARFFDTFQYFTCSNRVPFASGDEYARRSDRGR